MMSTIDEDEGTGHNKGNTSRPHTLISTEEKSGQKSSFQRWALECLLPKQRFYKNHNKACQLIKWYIHFPPPTTGKLKRGSTRSKDNREMHRYHRGQVQFHSPTYHTHHTSSIRWVYLKSLLRPLCSRIQVFSQHHFLWLSESDW